MSSFEPNKRHLRELLIYFFNLKKSGAEAHQLLAESVRRRGIGSIIGSRFVPNARRTIRWTMLRMKHKVPFIQNKCPIFDKKWRKLICTPDIFFILILKNMIKIRKFHILNKVCEIRKKR